MYDNNNTNYIVKYTLQKSICKRYKFFYYFSCIYARYDTSFDQHFRFFFKPINRPIVSLINVTDIIGLARNKK